MTWKKLLGFLHPREKGVFVGRARTCDDTALKYRMGAGNPGDVNRTHPASIVPAYPDATNPPDAYGQAVQIDATSHNVRKTIVGDNTLDNVYGITVRPYPIQDGGTAGSLNAAAGLGSATPPTNQVIDVLTSGFIMGKLNVSGAVKGGRVYVWAVATSGAHKIGGFEVAACATKTILLDEKTMYNGVEDANLNVEIAFNL